MSNPTATAPATSARARRRRLTPLEKAAVPGADDGAYVPCPSPKSAAVSVVASTPSPWWADHVKANGRSAFPPPADHTPMVACESGERRCGRTYPFYYGVGCMCEDCRQVRWHAYVSELRKNSLLAGEVYEEPQTLAREAPAELPPHAAALAELEAVNGELYESKLPSESEQDLLGQIAHYQATGSIVVFFPDGTAQDQAEPPPPAL